MHHLLCAGLEGESARLSATVVWRFERKDIIAEDFTWPSLEQWKWFGN